MRFLATFIVMFFLWILFSGMFDLFHLTLGLISTLIVCAWSSDILFESASRPLRERVRIARRFVSYFFWLNWQIVLANIHVIYLALNPRMIRLIEPQMVRFKTRLKTDVERFVFANSITLTPGTITVRIEGDEFLVHAISDMTAQGLPGEMEARVERIFA